MSLSLSNTLYPLSVLRNGYVACHCISKPPSRCFRFHVAMSILLKSPVALSNIGVHSNGRNGVLDGWGVPMSRVNTL